MIPKEKLWVERDCFGGFVAVNHIDCPQKLFGNTTPHIVDEAGYDVYRRGLGGRYICEKCNEEVTREIWASLFKKRIEKP